MAADLDRINLVLGELGLTADDQAFITGQDAVSVTAQDLSSPAVTYDADGNVSTVTYADTSVKTYTYTDGFLTSIVHPLIDGRTVTKTFTYDADNILQNVAEVIT